MGEKNVCVHEIHNDGFRSRAIQCCQCMECGSSDVELVTDKDTQQCMLRMAGTLLAIVAHEHQSLTPAWSTQEELILMGNETS